MIVYNYDADLEVSDTWVRSSLLSWVEYDTTATSTRFGNSSVYECNNWLIQVIVHKGLNSAREWTVVVTEMLICGDLWGFAVFRPTDPSLATVWTGRVKQFLRAHITPGALSLQSTYLSSLQITFNNILRWWLLHSILSIGPYNKIYFAPPSHRIVNAVLPLP